MLAGGGLRATMIFRVTGRVTSRVTGIESALLPLQLGARERLRLGRERVRARARQRPHGETTWRQRPLYTFSHTVPRPITASCTQRHCNCTGTIHTFGHTIVPRPITAEMLR